MTPSRQTARWLASRRRSRFGEIRPAAGLELVSTEGYGTLPRQVKYWPNPAHKRETSEAGPPRWRPDKTPCPRLTIDERNTLLQSSIADPKLSDTVRYALRRSEEGTQWFTGRLTGYDGEEAVFHGYPTAHVPARVLRLFMAQGEISDAEYRRMIRQLG